ncbi:nucleotide exchange factor GrpE [Glycomyces luteolus]|uniref:Protein GrpE n=1 Tax=Glycomyces luteolus TaxID=2670330 RepID=A0A9X3PCQ3_9ACTN|nr:nucleotide exchange factor GrpE [Glycomyces luteolus]MDA1362931.1 nucleotide exchange factor GrpE [Glycomyces luteolus]
MTDEGNKDADDVQEPEGGGAEDELTVDDILAAASDDGQAADDAVAVLQSTVEERTRDLQRITAEFQNYRKRVERDKARSSELATAAVLQSLLPVLDDMDRARDHGDLNGPFGSVAEQLVNALAKHGLESFGTKGDAFDPQIHEAVAHMQMPGVDGPTCIDVMRSGYRLGDKLLRPALVAVAEPSDDAEPVAAEAEPEPEAPEAEAEAPEAESEGDEAEEIAEEEAIAAAESEGMTDVEPGGDAEPEGKTKKKKDKGDKDS